MEILKYESDTKFTIKTDFAGQKYIEGDRGWGAFRVCSAKDFFSKKAIIMRGDQKVTYIK